MAHFQGASPKKYDLVCVLSSEGHGWILEKLAKVITNSYEGNATITYSLYNLPTSHNYLFMHYKWLFKSLKFNPKIWNSKLFVWYTHPNEVEPTLNEQRFIYNRYAYVISACKMHSNLLIKQGIDSKRVFSVVGAGADPSFFKTSIRQNNVVGLCSAYYDRKRPDLLLLLVEKCPQYHFILLGKGWEQYSKFDQLSAYENFTYHEISYRDYPIYYQQMSVFLSLSTIEGGPVPLLEAMMSNIVPVVSNTGFAPELIKNGLNGYIFEHDIKIEQLINMINEAMRITHDIRNDVIKYTWEHFALKVQDSIKECA